MNDQRILPNLGNAVSVADRRRVVRGLAAATLTGVFAAVAAGRVGADSGPGSGDDFNSGNSTSDDFTSDDFTSDDFTSDDLTSDDFTSDDFTDDTSDDGFGLS
jgi:hypothetical protein